MRIFQHKEKPKKAVLLAVILIILIVILVPPIFPSYGSLQDNSKNFASAVITSIIGVVIFVLKKNLDKKIRGLELDANPADSKKNKELSNAKELSLTAEFYEIFLFMILPAIAFYGVIPSQIKENPWLVTTIFLGMVLLWYIPIQWPISKQYKAEEGKLVKAHVDTFFTYMMILGGFFTVLIFIFQSFTP